MYACKYHCIYSKAVSEIYTIAAKAVHRGMSKQYIHGNINMSVWILKVQSVKSAVIYNC